MLGNARGRLVLHDALQGTEMEEAVAEIRRFLGQSENMWARAAHRRKRYKIPKRIVFRIRMYS